MLGALPAYPRQLAGCCHRQHGRVGPHATR